MNNLCDNMKKGDQYVDPGHHEREYAKKQKAKMIDKVPFRPSSPAKKRFFYINSLLTASVLV